MAAEHTSDIVEIELDEARSLMYNVLCEDDRIPDEVIEQQLRLTYIEELQRLYDNRDEVARQAQQ